MEYLISIIMPVYNVEKYLEEAFQSIEDQSRKNFELIIVNDGSTDNSKIIIDNFVYPLPITPGYILAIE